MLICDLAPHEFIVLTCASCQLSVQWTKAALELAVGPRTPLNNTGLHERLRWRGCGKVPSNARLSWQPQE